MTELPSRSDFDDYSAWSGRDVVDADGERLGAIELIFLDEATDAPEWVLVKRDDREVFVPLADAMVGERSIRVAQAAGRVGDVPDVEVGETLSVADEKRLYEHYGLDYSREESDTVLPEGAAVAEERPRLKKYVGAPVPAPAAEEPATEPAAAAEPEPEPEPEPSVVTGDMAPRNLSDATPSELPPSRPQAFPPPGGFTTERALEERGSKLMIAIPAVLAGAIAGLIAVLAWRRRG